MDIASQLQQEIKSIFNSNGREPKPVLFAKALARALSNSDYNIIPESVHEDYIRFNIPKCMFVEKHSPSLCAIMQGIIAGLAYFCFGYSKIIIARGAEHHPKPCCIDLYIKQTTEAEHRVGVEYSKHSVGILRGDSDAQIIASQRQGRRKLILGLFTDMSLTMRESSSVRVLAEKFISNLSNIPEIRVAALYMRDSESNSLNLEAQFGLPKDIIPSVRAIEGDGITKYGDELFEAVEEFNGWRLEIGKKLSVRSFTSAKIRTKYQVAGVLNIGWKSTYPVSSETREALQASCTLLGVAIEDLMVYSELENAYQSNLIMLNNLVSYVDQFSANHSKRVAGLAKAIADEMNLPREEQEIVHRAGLFHDIGKINIPSTILNKPGRLTSKEFEMVKEHPVAGAKLLAPLPAYLDIVPAILCHHERLDGSGYPGGLTKDDIPMRARIVAAADIYDAMTAKRAYREARDKDEVLREIKEESGTKYDTAVVDALMAAISSGKMESDEDNSELLLQNKFVS